MAIPTLNEALSEWIARTPAMTHEECSKHGAFTAAWAAREPEVKALRDALRTHAIIKTADFRGRFYRCNQCETAWTPDDTECHQTGCLAAPEDSHHG